MSRLLLLRDGGQGYALPVETVRLVAPAMPTVRLPLADDVIEGVASYGSAIVPQIPLGALVGSGEHGGAMVVVTASAAGDIALRVTATERVIDVAAQLAEPIAGQGLVVARMTFGQHDIRLLDPGRLVLPARLQPALERFRGIEPESRSSDPTGPSAASTQLLCRAGGRLFALPLERVASVEDAHGAVEALDLTRALGLPGADRAGARIYLNLGEDRLALDVDSVVGVRHRDDSRDAAERPEDLDVDRLADLGRRAGMITAARPPVRQDVARNIPLFALKADGRAALVPRSKVARVGLAEHWRAMPQGGRRLLGIVALHGHLLPAVDLASLFNAAARRRDLVAAVEAGGGLWALGCDAIVERHARIEGRPVTVDGLPLLGEARTPEGMLPVVDLDRLGLFGTAS